MNNKGYQANQTGVIWAVVVGFVVLLLGGMWAISSVNNNIDQAKADLQTNVDAKLQGVNTKIDTATGQLNTAVGELRTTAAGLEDIEVLTDPSLCDNIDGCGGQWDVPYSWRSSAASTVESELNENDFRELYRQIRDDVSVNDNEDIVSSTRTQLGDVETNFEPNRGLNHNEREVTVDMVVKVVYHEDGESDTKTKYFRVQALITNLEDGFGESDVEITSVSRVSSDFVLP